MSVSIALLGSTSNFSSIPAKGNDVLELHVRLSAFRLGKKKHRRFVGLSSARTEWFVWGTLCHFEGYQVYSIKITTRRC